MGRDPCIREGGYAAKGWCRYKDFRGSGTIQVLSGIEEVSRVASDGIAGIRKVWSLCQLLNMKELEIVIRFTYTDLNTVKRTFLAHHPGF